ncbi:unnamed protein product (macronuclear) [Paramecium tetraurelia]|uniref:Uncharacterized protein n=1 Tax=Paramecium tetraurelia TaxID=5888 RepID=A0DSN4_PARTE|nr:uncharacterized protein GSPATT00019744001 [Paramecium tetraurelia]CAK86051.1 unnamed protein product [Paramecium tetraurelia]|eukprot:XP_001453448.1 hypothetical protein (macronuclear) [Paramecium tetraurelia strain d4-2]
MRSQLRNYSKSGLMLDSKLQLLQPLQEHTQSDFTSATMHNIELQYYEYDIYSSNQSKLNPRLLFREAKRKDSYFNFHQETAINITFLFLQFLKENKSLVRKFLFANVVLDVVLRIAIFTLLCLKLSTHTKITIYFITLFQISRVFHMCCTIKLLFMDQFNLQNRSFIPISHLYRKNFITEEEPRECDLKPLNYKNNILSCRTILFVLLPVEFCFLCIPKKQIKNITNTIMISSYILKSIEVIIYDAPLLILMSLHDGLSGYINLKNSSLIFILLIADILKYVILNIYLVIFSETGQNNTIKF